MIRFLSAAFSFLLLLSACAPVEKPEPSKTYLLRGTIVARLPERNFVTVNHDAIPDLMEPMKMSYEVRGQKVTELPADGSRISATLHITGDGYWLTGVRPLR